MSLFGLDIPGIVNDAMGSELLSCTLVKIALGDRPASDEPRAETTTSYSCRGVLSRFTTEQMRGTQVKSEDRMILLLGRSISSDDSVAPVPGDRITVEGSTYEIVGGSSGLGVTRDPAKATYKCHGRKRS